MEKKLSEMVRGEKFFAPIGVYEYIGLHELNNAHLAYDEDGNVVSWTKPNNSLLRMIEKPVKTGTPKMETLEVGDLLDDGYSMLNSIERVLYVGDNWYVVGYGNDVVKRNVISLLTYKYYQPKPIKREFTIGECAKLAGVDIREFKIKGVV